MATFTELDTLAMSIQSPHFPNSSFTRIVRIAPKCIQRISMSAADGDIRLANGAVAGDSSAEYGRLEIFYRGGWGTVCDNAFIGRSPRRPSFSRGSVSVACRQLGFEQGIQLQALVRS